MDSSILGHRKTAAILKGNSNIKDLTQELCQTVGGLLELSSSEGLLSTMVYVPLHLDRAESWPTTSVSPRALAHTSPGHPGAQEKKPWFKSATRIERNQS